nr:beta-ketoacyl synthase N-terminal-like domain-containing protein [Halomonas piscis]
MPAADHDDRPEGRVAVTAASVLSAIGEDLNGFTAALLGGHSGVAASPSGSPAARLDAFALADWAERHLADDPVLAGRLRRVAGRASRPAQTAAALALDAVRAAGVPPGERTGVIVAGSNLALEHQASTVLGHRQRPTALRASYALTHLDVDIVGAVSELTGARGEGWALGGGSASGTLAVIQAARMLHAGWLDHCLVVAPMAELSATEIEAFRRAGAMADGGDGTRPAHEICRPFDTERCGFVYGQGAAAMVLERTAVADRRNAPVLAEIAGYGQCLDARRGTEPDCGGQVAAMRAALDCARLEPTDVDYINAHGTGSVLGDETEAQSIRTVFGTDTPPVNTTKSLVGHCLTAAGLIELVASIAQMRAGACHPNPNLHAPVDDTVAFVGRTARQHRIRTALSNSFAFGGINATVLVRATR